MIALAPAIAACSSRNARPFNALKYCKACGDALSAKADLGAFTARVEPTATSFLSSSLS